MRGGGGVRAADGVESEALIRRFRRFRPMSLWRWASGEIINQEVNRLACEPARAARVAEECCAL